MTDRTYPLPLDWQSFLNAYQQLQRRIQLFLALPIEDVDELSLQSRLKQIGETADQATPVD